LEHPAVKAETKNQFLHLRAVVVPLVFYMAASQLALTLLYTIVAYFVSLARKTGTDFGNTVNEIASQYIVLSLATAATLLTLTIWQADKALYRHVAFWNDLYKPLWQLDRSRKDEFWRGLSSGTLGACTFLLFFTLSGQLNYLGIYITSTLGTPIFPLFFVNLLALALLLVCEEYIFRHKILRNLLVLLPPGAAVAVTTALHILVRHLQFQLEPVDYLSLTALNLTLGFFFVKSGKCHRSLGFIVAFLCLLHNMGGLALWGNESPSFFLFKAAPHSIPLLSGGSAGPLAGLGLFVVILIFTLGAYLTWRRELEARRHLKRTAHLRKNASP
jgi:hypothetical protein